MILQEFAQQEADKLTKVAKQCESLMTEFGIDLNNIESRKLFDINVANTQEADRSPMEAILNSTQSLMDAKIEKQMPDKNRSIALDVTEDNQLLIEPLTPFTNEIIYEPNQHITEKINAQLSDQFRHTVMLCDDALNETMDLTKANYEITEISELVDYHMEDNHIPYTAENLSKAYLEKTVELLQQNEQLKDMELEFGINEEGRFTINNEPYYEGKMTKVNEELEEKILKCLGGN